MSTPFLNYSMPRSQAVVFLIDQFTIYLLFTKIIHYEKESIFFDDDAFACLYGRGKGGDHRDW